MTLNKVLFCTFSMYANSYFMPNGMSGSNQLGLSISVLGVVG